MASPVPFDYSDRVLKPGYTSCLGCGEALVMRIVAQAAGKNSIFTSATGCSEIFTSRYPQSSWACPWIHSLFENSAAVASGVYYALKHKGKLSGLNIVATGGDGGTADIGLQCLSGALERGDEFLYVCWDNEAYMNTGIQRSSLTPLDASTTTSPAGKNSWGNDRPKKDLPMIVAAHNVAYIGVGSCGYYRELPSPIAGRSISRSTPSARWAGGATLRRRPPSRAWPSKPAAIRSLRSSRARRSPTVRPRKAGNASKNT